MKVAEFRVLGRRLWTRTDSRLYTSWSRVLFGVLFMVERSLEGPTWLWSFSVRNVVEGAE